ncbi:hypothetical protein M8J77_007931 [Diaphorina citri]|nr:hypothetical protein M8J77_007931 [Diaphorina citri]
MLVHRRLHGASSNLTSQRRNQFVKDNHGLSVPGIGSHTMTSNFYQTSFFVVQCKRTNTSSSANCQQLDETCTGEDLHEANQKAVAVANFWKFKI